MAAETIYDHPRYYDVLFGWDRSQEANFYHLVFERCGVAMSERVLEVACGTGHVARLLAQRGWSVTGLDIRPSMVAFFSGIAAAEGTRVETLCADMTSFRTEVTFAAACNPMSSFRLLPKDAAQRHLRTMRAALRPGGVYVLDMDFMASSEGTAVTTDESWEMTRGAVTVRADNESVHVTDDGVERVLAWAPEVHLRAYTAAEFAQRVDAAADFRIESWHPESSRATGVSEFSIDGATRTPVTGRAMVVLRRR